MFLQKVEIQKCGQILCGHKTHFSCWVTFDTVAKVYTMHGNVANSYVYVTTVHVIIHYVNLTLPMIPQASFMYMQVVGYVTMK